eukprot:GEMP01055448.1.p1 GENE.GEMP01055448.1~~GEMP01055448.1.p1  ORF type:complete len:281 (+),score=45.96 GEMP01055448.1:28-843(+)
MSDWADAPDPEKGIVSEGAPRRRQTSSSSALETVSGSMDVATLAFSAYTATRSQASDLQNKYARLDLYRPYFDVNTKDVAIRLAFSLIPKRSSGSQMRKPDLYGPMVLAFTLASLLHTSMIQSRYSPTEGTTIGLALFLSLSYVVFMTFVFKIAGAIFDSGLKWDQLCVTFGYGLFGVCIPVFAKCYVHRNIGLLLLPVCGLPSVFNVGYALSKGGSKERLPFAACGAALHFLFILYVWSFTAGVPAADRMVNPIPDKIIPDLQVGQKGIP